ncbi:MAG: hypothetical protein LBI20_02460 [Holosporales bacterium]|jgi:hypothetical protein|nr:hypothetical protein [Holosporales bacterium]
MTIFKRIVSKIASCTSVLMLGVGWQPILPLSSTQAADSSADVDLPRSIELLGGGNLCGAAVFKLAQVPENIIDVEEPWPWSPSNS